MKASRDTTLEVEKAGLAVASIFLTPAIIVVVSTPTDRVASRERIDPGDKAHCLVSITKVTSTPAAADAIDRLYGEIMSAGPHEAASIEVAEAAKGIGIRGERKFIEFGAGAIRALGKPGAATFDVKSDGRL